MTENDDPILNIIDVLQRRALREGDEEEWDKWATARLEVNCAKAGDER